jgi:hypothetical protein
MEIYKIEIAITFGKQDGEEESSSTIKKIMNFKI